MRTLAGRLGLKRSGSGWGPCPICSTEKTSDGRAPLRIYADGWWCVFCESGGSSEVEFAKLVMGKTKADREVYDAVGDGNGGAGGEAGGRGLPVRPLPHGLGEASRLRIVRALGRAVPMEQCAGPHLERWLAARGIDRRAPAAWLRPFTADFWPGYSRFWPVIVPACSGQGKILSMHGVAITADAPRKTTWPKGIPARELLFAAPRVRRWLAGTEKPDSDVVIVEGATDFLTATPRLPDCSVIGITSGAAGALRIVPRARNQRWFVATDPDETGRKYQEQVAEALFPTPVYPFPLR